MVTSMERVARAASGALEIWTEALHMDVDALDNVEGA